MKKVVLFLLALCSVVVSCRKPVLENYLSYTVETAQNLELADIYVPDKGTYNWSLLVKYLGGTHEDSVTISISGLPADVKVARDTYKMVPTFGADFVLTTNNAVHATYPLTITTVARGSDPKTYHVNMTVISADCASVLWGTYAGSNACTARDYTYTATGTSTGVVNELNMTNFGGYGLETTTRILINCVKDSVYIPQQNIGNGTNLSGSGVITGNTISIQYTAVTTPEGFPETCNVTLVKQ